jgi:hypothetical protein
MAPRELAPEERQLKADIETRFEGRWRFVGAVYTDDEASVTAESVETIPKTQAAATPEKLIAAIEWYEQSYGPSKPAVVLDGVGNTENI